MKTLEQFVKDNEGQFLEVAGSSNAKFQCVDCVNGYIRDVLGLPIIEWTNAIDFKNKANGNYEIIYNDINNSSLVPDVGDIVVYKHPNNIGHIGFCIRKGTALTFGIFEENWPVGSPCKSVLNKKYILGDYVVDYWMRPKSVIISDMTDEQKRILDFLNGKSEGDVREAFGALNEKPNKDAQIATLSQKVLELDSITKKLQEQIDILTSEVKSNNEIILDWQQKFQSANEQVSNATEQLTTITEDRNKYRRLYENLLSNTADKMSAIELIKLGLIKLLGKK